ncbi:potassium-transporting ATPase subunit F [Leucobacter chromiireducens]|nr:potassium-transporting ATPase subunit F [Leucobacter chromiireducens]
MTFLQMECVLEVIDGVAVLTGLGALLYLGYVLLRPDRS